MSKRVFRVRVIETQLVGIDRFVVADSEQEAEQLAIENRWAENPGLWDVSEEAGSTEKTEIDYVEEASEEDLESIRNDMTEGDCAKFFAALKG